MASFDDKITDSCILTFTFVLGFWCHMLYNTCWQALWWDGFCVLQKLFSNADKLLAADHPADSILW